MAAKEETKAESGLFSNSIHPAVAVPDCLSFKRNLNARLPQVGLIPDFQSVVEDDGEVSFKYKNALLNASKIHLF